MALEKEVIPFPLSGKLDTKVASSVLPVPNFSLLENTRRDKAGRISKRYGYQELGSEVVASSEVTEIDSPTALAVFEDRLIQTSKQTIFSYSQKAKKSKEVAAWVGVDFRVDDVLKNNYEQTQVDSATLNGITLFTWEDSRGGVYSLLRDDSSGTWLNRGDQAKASATHPRCVVYGEFLYQFCIVGTSLWGQRVHPVAATFGPWVEISTIINSSNISYDVIAQDDYILVAFNVTGASEIRLMSLDASLVVINEVSIAEAATDALTLVRSYSSNFGDSLSFVCWRNASGLRFSIYTSSFSVIAIDTIELAANTVRLSGVALPNGSGSIRLFYEISAASSYNHYVKKVDITDSGTFSAGVFLRGVGLASRPWTYSGDTSSVHIALVHQSDLQSTYFVVRSTSIDLNTYVSLKNSVAFSFHYVVFGRARYGLAGGLMFRNMVPAVSAASSSVFKFPLLTKGRVISENNNFLTFRGVSQATLDFESAKNFRSVEAAESLILSGGVLSSFDGATQAEHGFFLFPENLSAAESTGGSLTTTGTYQYKAIYEWIDARGRVHRSAPSPALSITLTGVNNRVTVTVPTLRLTNKLDVSIVLFRTEDAGTAFYRASSPTSLAFNDLEVDTVSIVDDLSDSDLLSREALYTNGGVLENVAPPSASIITSANERVWISPGDESALLPSKKIVIDKPVEFSDSLKIKIDTQYGEVTALGAIDDKVIVFKERAMFFIAGDGPNDLGGGGVFTPLTFITSDAGCSEPNSVVLTPRGLMFKSAGGIYLLTRDLTVSYIGSPVEDWNSYVITSATLLPEQNEVRFTHKNGPTLVYNYFFDEWHVWPDLIADDGINWQNQFVAILCRPGDSIRAVVEVPGHFMDIQRSYPMRVGFSWAPFNGLQGFQRVYKALLQGRFKSPHKLKVSVGYDFTDVIHDEFLWDYVSMHSFTDYGDGATYGSDSYYGSEGGDNPYQVRIRPSRQKSESLRIVVEDAATSGSCESFCLDSIAFEVGRKRGVFRLPASQSV